eukprot:CAMPEP_0117425744 /NCGR_PEP_ID=MMETSP0758-20121206/5988_1 /TAXON_ID=63605 /ORGANISM="Percolomonas cosmopolitus, Strain AE-1 (ATCC 50343)" /LENGTH=785 /DNA_ID=CAMNT_0005210479 /DNA_START=303 /DNA_END=2657 /DNA_ORIENTATION=-
MIDNDTDDDGQEEIQKPKMKKKKHVYVLSSIFGLKDSIFFPPYPPPETEEEEEEQIKNKFPNVQKKALTKVGKPGFKWTSGAVKFSVVRSVMSSAGIREVKGADPWQIMWGKHLKPYQFWKLNDGQRVNHFPGSGALGRKDLMYLNFDRMRSIHGTAAYNFFPETYFFPKDRDKLYRKYKGKGKMWIVKPKSGSCGRGIRVVKDVSHIEHSDCLVQEYLSKPLLINKKKFDMRIYVLVTCFDPLKIYIFNDGLVRFATEDYKRNNTNRFACLTNYSVNKKSDKYISNVHESEDDEGSKWSLCALRRWFREHNISDAPLWDKIYDMIIKSFISVELRINSKIRQYLSGKRNVCFELFGFDVFIDKNLKPWIIEVNVGPSLALSSPLDTAIKTQLLNNVLNLVKPRLPENDESDVSTPKKKKRAYAERTLAELQRLDKLTYLTKYEKKVIQEIEEEHAHRRNFIRLFPTRSSESRYKKYFLDVSYNTMLCFLYFREPLENRKALLLKPSPVEKSKTIKKKKVDYTKRKNEGTLFLSDLRHLTRPNSRGSTNSSSLSSPTSKKAPIPKMIETNDRMTLQKTQTLDHVSDGEIIPPSTPKRKKKKISSAKLKERRQKFIERMSRPTSSSSLKRANMDPNEEDKAIAKIVTKSRTMIKTPHMIKMAAANIVDSLNQNEITQDEEEDQDKHTEKMEQDEHDQDKQTEKMEQDDEEHHEEEIEELMKPNEANLDSLKSCDPIIPFVKEEESEPIVEKELLDPLGQEIEEKNPEFTTKTHFENEGSESTPIEK